MLRRALRIVVAVLRFLAPVPLRVGHQSKYRRQSTGLAIPSLDVLAILFGLIALIGYYL